MSDVGTPERVKCKSLFTFGRAKARDGHHVCHPGEKTREPRDGEVSRVTLDSYRISNCVYIAGL